MATRYCAANCFLHLAISACNFWDSLVCVRVPGVCAVRLGEKSTLTGERTRPHTQRMSLELAPNRLRHVSLLLWSMAPFLFPFPRIAILQAGEYAYQVGQTMPLEDAPGSRQRGLFLQAVKVSVGTMFRPALGVDFDRGFSSGCSPPDIFRLFRLWPRSQGLHTRHKSVFFLRKSDAKSVLLDRKIHRNMGHNHQKNPACLHSAETCALMSPFPLLTPEHIPHAPLQTRSNSRTEQNC